MNCPNCRWEAVEVVDVGTASGRKTYRCPKCRAKWREKNAAAQALGSLGGKARAEALTEEQLRIQAEDAANTRWRREKDGSNSNKYRERLVDPVPFSGSSSQAAKQVGAAGGLARAENLSAEELSIQAKVGGNSRWNGGDDSDGKTRDERMKIAKANGSHLPQEWDLLLKACDYKCVKCGSKEKIGKDHILPVYIKGSSDSIDNLQPLCQRCNAKKSAEAIDFRSASVKSSLPLIKEIAKKQALSIKR